MQDFYYDHIYKMYDFRCICLFVFFIKFNENINVQRSLEYLIVRTNFYLAPNSIYKNMNLHK